MARKLILDKQRHKKVWQNLAGTNCSAYLVFSEFESKKMVEVICLIRIHLLEGLSFKAPLHLIDRMVKIGKVHLQDIKLTKHSSDKIQKD